LYDLQKITSLSLISLLITSCEFPNVKVIDIHILQDLGCSDDQEPPTFNAARVRKLQPSAPQERIIAVLPDLDGPDHPAGAGLANNMGLPGADFLGELVGDALQRVEMESVSTAGVTGSQACGATARALGFLPDCHR
jgi:hypothetical protein